MDTNKVLDFFREIVAIPRESGHEEQIIAYLQDFAAERGLACRTDATGNVLITKEAAPGKEDVPPVCLQSHSDMVCEKKSGCAHDFARDPIPYVIENGWMIAPDTTLGADCGIGIAASLALLDSDLPTGKIECLFTVSEETGLDGAKALSDDFITSGTLLNLDSEDEGEIFVGCAGGLDTTARFAYAPVPAEDGSVAVSFAISGAMGGHSGDDIDKGRANAVQLLARFLYTQLSSGLEIISIDGGNKRNAIAREANCTAALPASCAAAAMEAFRAFGEDVRAEYRNVETELAFETSLKGAPSETIGRDLTSRLVSAMVCAPHGVLAMSREIPGLVQTSSNLASVKMSDGVIRIGSSQRSSSTSERRAAGDRMEACMALAGAEVAHENEYPGWQPNLDSEVLRKTVASYEKLFGVTPKVRAIHAGLECGLFLDKYPALDMVSFGPTLRGVHAPGERLDLASLDKFVALLEDVVVNF